MGHIISKITGLLLTTVATPSSGRRVLYAKADGWYEKDSTGTERKLITESETAIEKVYIAKITQTSTNAPTVAVLENTLSAAVVWTRGGDGDYTGTLAGAFPAAKTVTTGHHFINGNSSDLSFLIPIRATDNTVTLSAVNFDTPGVGLADGDLGNGDAVVEIRVYP